MCYVSTRYKVLNVTVSKVKKGLKTMLTGVGEGVTLNTSDVGWGSGMNGSGGGFSFLPSTHIIE